MRDRVDAVVAVVGSLLWRGFGLFLFILGGLSTVDREKMITGSL